MLLVAALAGALLGGWALQRHAGEQELRDLPESQRRAFFQRTLETLRTTCMEASGPRLTDYCREQANLAAEFPECDADCLELTRHFSHRATR
jgi:hypothetical protein